MQTPLQPPLNSLQSVRVGLAFLLTGSAVVFTATLALRLYSVIKAYDQQRLDQMHEAVLTRADYLKSTQSYAGCIAEVSQIPAESLFSSQAKTLQDQCQSALYTAALSQAQALADAGQLKEAIAALQALPTANTDAKVQQLTQDWSNRILQIAEGYYHLSSDAGLVSAIQTAGAITSGNPLYAEAQLKMRHWELEWVANEQHWQSAKAALGSHQPEAALLQARQITHPYWSQQAAPITNAAYAEIALRDQTASAAIQAEQSNQAVQTELPDQKDYQTTSVEPPSAVSRKLLLPLVGVGIILLLNHRSR